MSFQNWTVFVNQMMQAIDTVVSFDAFFAYDICQSEYSNQYYSNINTIAIDQYLSHYQHYDPLSFKQFDYSHTHDLMVLKQHTIHEMYQDFMCEHHIQDNIELWFRDDIGNILKGISLVRLQGQPNFTESEIKIIKGYHTFAKYHFSSYFNELISIQQECELSGQLTKKEKQIMDLMMKGQKNQTIANEMFISIHTVKTHVQHILQKMQVDTRQELMSKMLQYH